MEVAEIRQPPQAANDTTPSEPITTNRFTPWPMREKRGDDVKRKQSGYT
jgi:hypothetical protein